MFTSFNTSSTTALLLFTFDAGPENAKEHPAKLHPLRTIVGIPFPAQFKVEVALLTDEVVSLDTDKLARTELSLLDKTFEISLSCDSEVYSYCLNPSSDL